MILTTSPCLNAPAMVGTVWAISFHASGRPVIPASTPSANNRLSRVSTISPSSAREASSTGVSQKRSPAEGWVATEADREIAKILNIKESWVDRMPPRALHYNHRNALYFDWHVDNLAL